MREMPNKTALGFDIGTITDSPQRGAGDRLGRILEETKPKWMGRARPIPGDQPRGLALHPAELDMIEDALIQALRILERAKNR